MATRNSGGRLPRLRASRWAGRAILPASVARLEGMGIDITQFTSDVQFLGVGPAVMRVLFGLGANLRQPSA